MSSYAMTISCKLNEDDATNTVFVLDQVYDNNVSATSNLTTKPMANGDETADHMYNDPVSMSFRGTFSLNGSKGLVVDGNGARFENIQDLFEKIKDNGILCNIVKVQLVDKNDGSQIPKFKLRENMVLTSINWVEKINSLDFSFTFTQVLMADISEESIDPTDENLPPITEPKTLNFTDTLIDWTELDKILNSELVSKKVVNVDFFEAMSSYSLNNLIAAGVGMAIATIIIFASNPGGWVVGGLLLLGAAVGWIVNSIISIFKKKNERKKLFKVYKDPKKMNEEIKKYGGFVERFHNQMSVLNEKIQVFSVSKNEPQECLLTIDNGYYDFVFEKNNINNTYKLTILDTFNNDVIIKTLEDISSSPSGINDCNNQNVLFTTPSSNNCVYLILPVENENKDLTKYYLITSEFDLQEYNKRLTEIISDTLDDLI